MECFMPLLFCKMHRGAGMLHRCEEIFMAGRAGCRLLCAVVSRRSDMRPHTAGAIRRMYPHRKLRLNAERLAAGRSGKSRTADFAGPWTEAGEEWRRNYR